MIYEKRTLVGEDSVHIEGADEEMFFEGIHYGPKDAQKMADDFRRKWEAANPGRKPRFFIREIGRTIGRFFD